MTLEELKKSIQEYQYLEHDDVIDFVCAVLLSNLLKLGDPVWSIVIGASSGGKSQILRPLSSVNPKSIHRVDDLTENTLLSGMKVHKDAPNPSLLHRIGVKGIMLMSDITVIFSKNKESLSAILSQLRMVYDGELTKFVGTTGEPLEWKGYMGFIAGGTTAIYEKLKQASEMGERFLCWRLKDYDADKATDLAMSRKIYGRNLDAVLGEMYKQYVKETIEGYDALGSLPIEIPEHLRLCIKRIASFAETSRTVASMDFFKKEMTAIPVPAMPMRTSLQLTAIVKALCIMRKGNTGDRDEAIINWCGYSLIDEEKRAVLRVLASVSHDADLRTQVIADKIGLATSVIGTILQNLAAVKIVLRTGDVSGLRWRINNYSDWELIRKIEGITDTNEYTHRDLSDEEDDEMKKVANEAFEKFNN